MRRLSTLVALVGLVFALSLPAGAIDTQAAFPDPALQSRYEHLTNELRCLVCQNQTIADSNASLAGDLRREVREMIARDESLLRPVVRSLNIVQQ